MNKRRRTNLAWDWTEIALFGVLIGATSWGVLDILSTIDRGIERNGGLGDCTAWSQEAAHLIARCNQLAQRWELDVRHADLDAWITMFATGAGAGWLLDKLRARRNGSVDGQ